MRVALVAYGSQGDVRPLVALGRALESAGHAVVVAGEGSAEPYVTEHGLEFRPLSGSVAEVLASGVSRAGVRAFRWRDRDWVDEIAAAATGCDVLVGLPIVSVHAMAAAEHVGAAGILAGLQPMEPTRDFVPTAFSAVRVPSWLNRPVGRALEVVGGRAVLRRVNRVRDAGTAPLRNPYHRLPYLGAWSPTLVPTPADWDAGSEVTGQWWQEVDRAWSPPEEVAAFLEGEERPVYVGFGSVAGPRVEYAVEQALRALHGHPVLLASPYSGDVGPEVLRIGTLPHEWLFPRCGAIVHAAGAGTAHAVARSGIPSVGVPFAFDQPFWAARLHALGAASRPVDRRSGWEAYETALRETVRARTAARDLGERMRAEAAEGLGAARAVTAIERIAGTAS
ncbi:MAG TPA: glycosyltransferase [Propionibacteriaceae bacterium]|nr:glycosyltransferase [Propionibacteriaceae bacterium]